MELRIEKLKNLIITKIFILFVGYVLLLNSTAFSQYTPLSKESLRHELETIYETKVEDITVTPKAKKQLQALINLGIERYSENPSKTNYSKIKTNFTLLIESIVEKKILKKGVSEAYEINSSSVEKATASPCHLYPFC